MIVVPVCGRCPWVGAITAGIRIVTIVSPVIIRVIQFGPAIPVTNFHSQVFIIIVFITVIPGFIF
jgi:hypothetical protein